MKRTFVRDSSEDGGMREVIESALCICGRNPVIKCMTLKFGSNKTDESMIRCRMADMEM